MYEDIYDAKMAVEHLSGFNVANRYLIVLYYNPARQTKKVCFTTHLCQWFRSDASGAYLTYGCSKCWSGCDVKVSTKDKEAELRAMQEKYGVDGALLAMVFLGTINLYAFNIVCVVRNLWAPLITLPQSYGTAPMNMHHSPRPCVRPGEQHARPKSGSQKN